jgi:hypothetical protein
MKHSLDTILDLLNTFIDERQILNKIRYDKDGKEYILNSEIFELESYFIQKKREYNINQRIDNSIVSDNIFQNFDLIEAEHAYKAIDYQFNFLYFLAKEYKPNKDLVEIIDSFIQFYSNQLTLADLIITKSGATRCKTNIRFALNSLRDLGLVLNRDKFYKRSWEPSILGLLTLINISLNKSKLSSKPFYKEFLTLKFYSDRLRFLPKEYQEDPTLVNSIQMFDEPTYIHTFLSNIIFYDLSDNNKKTIEKIITEFIDFTHNGLLVTDTGIQITKEFNELSKQFHYKMNDVQNRNNDLVKCLYDVFKIINTKD